MSRLWTLTVVVLASALLGMLSGCVVTGGGQVGVTVGVGREGAPRPTSMAPAESPESRRTLEFFEGQ